MADKKVPITAGLYQKLVDNGDGTYSLAVALAGGGSTMVAGGYRFDPSTLACVPTYDADNNQTSITYGPTADGVYFRQTSTWAPNNLWMGDSAFQAVDANGNVLPDAEA